MAKTRRAKELTLSEIANRSEYDEQVAIFTWAKLHESELPELKLLNGSINGVKLHPAVAARASMAGLRPGVPDITLDVPRSRGLNDPRECWHGLRIELKRRNGGKLSKEQSYFLEKLNSLGYRAVVCYGSDQAINEITSYLKGLYS